MPIPALDSENDVDFVLKHRIAGAAFLLFFGALFVPWVLGPPSEAVKMEPEKVPVVDERISPSEIEDELLEALQEEQDDEQEEQVYVSKITPLDKPSQPSSSEPDTSRPRAADNTNERSSRNLAGTSTDDEAIEPKPPANQEFAAPPAQQLNSPSVNDEAKVDVGWAVQVGIYTNPVGVQKVVADLRAKGFRPATTVVDTNQGKGTGTRVWLGPFAQRVDAAKAKAQLTEKTGEAGFIRVYP